MKSLLFATSLLMIFTACGKDDKEGEAPGAVLSSLDASTIPPCNSDKDALPTKAQETKPATQEGGSEKAGEAAPRPKAPEDPDYYELAPAKRKVPGKDMTFHLNGGKVSMCDVAIASSAKVVIFHFIQPTCYRCQNTADLIAQQLSGDYEHVLLFHRDAAKMKDEELDALGAEIIPGAKIGIDKSNTMNDFFRVSEDKTLMVAMNVSSEGFFVESPEATLEDVALWLESLGGEEAPVADSTAEEPADPSEP